MSTLFYLNQSTLSPWARHGIPVNTALTASDAMTLAQLDWTVELAPLYHNFSENMVRLPRHLGVRRMDNGSILGVCKSRYRPLQNSEAFGFFDTLVDAGEARFTTAGNIGLGEQVWLMAKLPNDINLGEDDVIEPYVLLSNSHDGSSTVNATFTPIRRLNQTTLSLSVHGVRDVAKVRHVGNVQQKVRFAATLLANANEYFFRVSNEFRAMTQVHLASHQVEDYYRRVFSPTADTTELSTRTLNRIEEARTVLMNGLGSQSASSRGTLWGAYTAIAEYVDHVELNRRSSRDISYLIDGSGAALKRKAFAVARAMIERNEVV